MPGRCDAGTIPTSRIGHVSAADIAQGADMLHYAIVFFVVALIAALFGFGGIAAGAVEIAQALFYIFVILFVVSLILGLVRRDS
jgi:uncharacterized membrane protein YtjA (UPF0391 family)